MAKFTLSKNERLKSKKAIDFLFEQGTFINQYPLKLVYHKKPLPEGQPPLLFSVSVSKRNFKSAVSRNRIKRLVREAYRTQCLALRASCTDANMQIEMMFIYIGKDMPVLDRIEKKVDDVLEKLLK